MQFPAELPVRQPQPETAEFQGPQHREKYHRPRLRLHNKPVRHDQNCRQIDAALQHFPALPSHCTRHYRVGCSRHRNEDEERHPPAENNRGSRILVRPPEYSPNPRSKTQYGLGSRKRQLRRHNNVASTARPQCETWDNIVCKGDRLIAIISKKVAKSPDPSRISGRRQADWTSWNAPGHRRSTAPRRADHR